MVILNIVLVKWHLMEFFLNQWQDVCHYSKRTRTCHLPPGCYHGANKAHVRDRIFKFSPIHASVTIRFQLNFQLNSVKVLPHLGKTPESICTSPRNKYVWIKNIESRHYGSPVSNLNYETLLQIYTSKYLC